MIMKKVYISPTLEIIETESEGVIAGSDIKIEGGTGGGADGGFTEETKKRQPGTPWGSAPWEE